jgi:hypothetical protein
MPPKGPLDRALCDLTAKLDFPGARQAGMCSGQTPRIWPCERGENDGFRRAVRAFGCQFRGIPLDTKFFLFHKALNILRFSNTKESCVKMTIGENILLEILLREWG